MSVDVIIENNVNSQNSESGQMNGYSNGHHGDSSIKHKSSSKDKHRDKDYEKSHKSSHSKDSHKSSSRSKEKHHGSSSNNKDKNRDRDSSKHSSSSNHREKDKDKEKGKHKSNSSNSSSHHKSSSKDKDRHKSKVHKDRDENKERSSSNSSSKDKSKNYHKSSSSSSHEKSKDRHNKTLSSASSSSSAKHKHSTSSSSSKIISQETFKSANDFLKPEPLSQENTDIQYKNGINVLLEKEKDENNYDRVVKEENEIGFNISAASSCDYSISQFQNDDATFVKKEASCDEESLFEQSNMNVENDDLEDDVPLAKRKNINMCASYDYNDVIPLAKRKIKEEDDEDVPLISRKKIKKEVKEKISKSKLKRERDVSDENEEKHKKKVSKKTSDPIKQGSSPTKRSKKEVEDEEVWRWWEEEKREDGVKWNSLEHKGPVFAPPYERMPKNVRFFYDGKPMQLSEMTEEAATFYAKMLNHDYCTKQIFNDNFFQDFRKTMTAKELEIIKDFKKCNFEEMHNYFVSESEKRKMSTKEEKLKKKEENEALIKEYGTCLIDGHKEKIGNFRLEPPGLFRGRGEHPKMGMIKRRIQAGDVSINCGAKSKVPSPPSGHHWKDVRHDNTVTWLASWVENVQGQVKYIMLNPSSKLKGEKDHVKYETARRLAKCIDTIRSTYRDEWKSKEMRVRQRAVALYFIDKLALRAGNEKDEDQADTVGCCSLRVEHVQLHKELNGKEYVVVFDFLGKDSIRYYNEVEVEKRVFKNLELFMENKKDGDDLFDRLNTQVLNEHLKELMDGLTAKVFRTYNASITLQNQLDLLTEENMTVPEKLLAYNRANRAVAILCNHQRSIPKGHEKSMENLKEKIRGKREAIAECANEYEKLKKAAKRSVKERILADKKLKQLERLKDQLKKMKLQETDRDENKTIALGTSKLNYLDPRISVAWCKKYQVPIEKIFNKTQRNKFLWAIHMADENYRF